MFTSSKRPWNTEIHPLSFFLCPQALHKSIEISILRRERKKISLPTPVLNLAKCVVQYCMSHYSSIQLAAMCFKTVEEWAFNFRLLDSNGFLRMIINRATHGRGFFSFVSSFKLMERKWSHLIHTVLRRWVFTASETSFVRWMSESLPRPYHLWDYFRIRTLMRCPWTNEVFK